MQIENLLETKAENQCSVNYPCNHHPPRKECALFVIGANNGICKYFNNFNCQNKNAQTHALLVDLANKGCLIHALAELGYIAHKKG